DAGAERDSDLRSGHVDLPRPLGLAAWVLDRSSSGLDLDSSPLPLDSGRLRLHRWLLGLSAFRPRHSLRSRVYSENGLRHIGLLLFADGRGPRAVRVWRFVRAPRLGLLLLRRLLRPRLRPKRLRVVVWLLDRRQWGRRRARLVRSDV